VTRSDAAPKIRGTAEYGTDLTAPGMVWGALAYSRVGTGRVLGIDLAAARRVPGVLAVIGPSEATALLPTHGGDPERPLFPSGALSYRGQPIAAVAAETLDAARTAAALVQATVEPGPPVRGLEEIFPEWPTDPERSPEVTAHVLARHGPLGDRFRTADFVVSETYRTQGIAQVALEPHACLAEIRDGLWWVRTTTQTPFGVREDLAALLGLPESQIVVEGSWVGGGFGGKGSSLLEPYALVLAAATGRPVKLALRYREEFQLVRSTLPAVFRLETSVKDGRMTARRVRMLLDTGASLPGRDFATGYSIGFLLGPYRYDAFEVEGVAVRTAKVPFGPHRAPLAPQCVFAAESHVDGIARRLGVDPIEFRTQHVWRHGDTTMFGQPVGPNALAEGLARAKGTAERWRGEGIGRHGLGVAVGFWSTGVGAGGESRLKLRPDGLVIEQGEREIGSGSIVRGLAAVAERTLGLPASWVHVEYLDTRTAPFDTGVFGSRTLGALGQSVQKAGESMLRELAKRAGASAAPTALALAVVGGEIVVRGAGAERPLRELLTPAELADGGLTALGKHYGGGGAVDPSRVVQGDFYPYSDFTGAVHLAEVDVDPETGRTEVIRCAAFQDAGVVMDQEMFRGQVEGAVAMGLGEALTEETLWAEDGRMLNPNLLDYRIPTLTEVPPIEVVALVGALGAGPFGAKGLGEPPIIPVPAAVANAIADATGARLTELPMTPERVARALKLL
jgi:CO/xanthine dehydrogenase Mo-binding subunit